jgi:hypothetical protein
VKNKRTALCDKAIQMDPSLAKNKQKMEMPGVVFNLTLTLS